MGMCLTTNLEQMLIIVAKELFRRCATNEDFSSQILQYVSWKLHADKVYSALAMCYVLTMSMFCQEVACSEILTE